ncbi:IS1/IS6 family transposase [Candidatus Pacearchaeota archaeon]|nr:IS1/IS6 family transposase [Candidatus Pacearchaeota archaeon]
MICIYCSSSYIVLNGHDNKGVQRYKCNDCHRRFCEKGIFVRHRFSKEIIINAIFLRSFPLSTRNVKRILKKIEFVKVSHVSIYNWVVKFAPYLIKLSLIKPINFSSIWHVDEKFIHVKGSKDPHAYLWIVSDSNSNIIAIHVSFERDCNNAKIVLQKAKEISGFSPEIIISDGLKGYKRACKKVFGRKTRHVIAHFEAVGIVHNKKLMKLSNNRAERINEFPALWLHVCRGFKRLDRAILFIEFFVINYNYLMEHPSKEKPKVEWEMVESIMRK